MRVAMTHTFALIPLFLLAASAILLAPATAGAQAPAKDDPGIAVITYGDLEITAILDTATTIPPGILFGRKQTDLAADLKAAGVTDGYFPGWVNAFVVKKGKETYVIDTGNGAADGFLAKMRVAGIDPATVNHVLLTHYHTDHVGGLLNPDGSKAFPKAKIYGSVEEDAYFLPPGGDGPPGAAPLPRLFAPYRGDDDYVTFSPGKEPLPGVGTVGLFGHTPGHTGFLFNSSEGPVLFWGDIVHAYLVQFAHPDVTISYDVDRAAAAATRQALLPELARDGWVVVGVHLPFPGIGKVEKDGDAFKWAPLGK